MRLQTIKDPQGNIPIHGRWYSVETPSLFGKSIGELEITKLSGSITSSVRRNGITVQNPDNDFILVENDELYVIGTRGQLSLFERAFGMSARSTSKSHLASLEKKIA